MNRTARLATFLIVLIFALMPSLAHADVTLPKIFSSNMVLQRGKPITCWGEAPAGERKEAVQNYILNRIPKWALEL